MDNWTSFQDNHTVLSTQI